MFDVLVLEDDELVLDVTVQALEDAGYAVQMAENGDDALRYLKASQVCQLLITDINLGTKMNGFDVVQHARALRPELKVIYYSGLPGNWQGRPLEENARRLNKPFRFADLLESLNELKVWPSLPPMLGRDAEPF